MAASDPSFVYKPPSDLKPALFMLFMGAIWPCTVFFCIFTSPHGLYGLNISCTLISGLLWQALVRSIILPFFRNPLTDLPRPASEHAIFGDMSLFLNPAPYKGIATWFREIPNNGLIYVRGPLHLSDHLVLTSPAAAQEVLNTRCYEYEKNPPTRKILRLMIGNGLVTTEGLVHKAQRRAVAPAFQGKHIRELTPLFWSKARQMVDGVISGTSGAIASDTAIAKSEKNNTKSRFVEISTLASRATLDIIGMAGFGRDFNTLEDDEDELAKLYDFLFDPNRGFNVTYILVNSHLPDWLLRLLPWQRNKRVQAASMKLRAICGDLIAIKRDRIQEDKSQDGDERASEVDILSVLLRDDQIDDEILVDQMLTFLAAGHETTANATTWACYLLSKYPSVQAKLRRELQSSQLAVAMDPSASQNYSEITLDIIDSLSYLQAVVNEVLRLFPPAPMFVRCPVVPTTIQGHFVPEGTDVSICPWAINRSPDLWGPDSDDFRPERWMSQDASNKLNSYEFMTFLHGPRSCIGQAFARAELKCLVSSLVLSFKMELTSNEEAVAEGAVTIKIKNGLKLKLTTLGDNVK